MPELEKLVKDTDRDFEILTIMAPGLQGEKTEEEFVKWFDQQDYKSVPVLYNPDGSSFADYQVRSIPTEVFIDSHGKIGHVQLGAISNDDAKKIIKTYNKKMKHEASFFISCLHQKLHRHLRALRHHVLQHQKHQKLHLHYRVHQQEQMDRFRQLDVGRLFAGTSPTMVLKLKTISLIPA